MVGFSPSVGRGSDVRGIGWEGETEDTAGRETE